MSNPGQSNAEHSFLKVYNDEQKFIQDQSAELPLHVTINDRRKKMEQAEQAGDVENAKLLTDR